MPTNAHCFVELVKYKTIVMVTSITAIEELAGVTQNNHPTRGLALLYHFVQFGQGGTGGQAGRNLDMDHPEVDGGHLPDFGQSKSSAACASSSLRYRADPRVVGALAKAMDLE